MDIRPDAIDKVIKNAISVLEGSKYQIYEICDHALSEKDRLTADRDQVIAELERTIKEVDKLEQQFRGARVRLTEVSRDFQRYKEEDIRRAYENATQFQLNLIVARENENHLKSRRDELQQRIRNVQQTVERAEAISSQMNVVLEYLSGDLTQVTRILESAKNRQLLGLKIILAQEEERKRIAREIHDGPAQSIANIGLRAEIAERMMDKKEWSVVRDEVVDLKKQARLSLEEIRKIIFNLRPMTLDDLGLVPTIRKFTQDFEEKTKIRTSLELTGKEIRLPSAMEVAVFRLVQEAFSNALKHAHASFLSLEMIYEPDKLILVIQDNGQGFQADATLQKANVERQHFGLVGMQERLELLEGTLEIESNKDSGTKLELTIPFKTENGKE